MFKYTGYYLDDDIVPHRTFDCFMPEKVTQKTALFFVHGGGWVNGNTDNYHVIMHAYCKRGYICGTTTYRLLPPGGPGKRSAVDQLKDVRESFANFVAVLQEQGITSPRVAVFSTSAGAHLASLLVCAEPGECGEKCDLPGPWIKPACGLLQSVPATFEPWPEAYPAMWGMMERAAGGVWTEEPEKFRNLSLERFIRPDNPPLFFMEAQIEETFPSRLNVPLFEKHRQWGIPSRMKTYKYAEHGFFYDLSRPIQREAFEDIIDFLSSLEKEK